MTQEQESLINYTKNFLNDEKVKEYTGEYLLSYNEKDRVTYEAINGLRRWIELFQAPSEKIKVENKVKIGESKQEIETIIKLLEVSNKIITTIRSVLVDFGYQNIADRLGETALGFPIYKLREVSKNAKS